MKISLQEKIAELEQRIVALEGKQSPKVHTTLTPQQHGHLKRMWGHFDAMFVEMGKIFKQ